MTTSSAMNAVQAAVFGVLNGDATLGALVDRIGDSLPEGASAGAFVVLTITSETPDRRLSDTAGHARRLLVSVAAHVEDTQGATGAKRAQQIAGRVVELLDDAVLTVPGWTFISCDYDASTPQHDGPWRSVTTDFQILVEDV